MPTFESEEKLNHFLDQVKEEAKAARGDLDKNVADNLNMLRGKQWNSKIPPAFLNNIIESAAEDKVGKLSETRPNISVLPSVNGLDAVAEVLTKATTGIWDRRKIEYKAERLAMWGVVAGASFVGTPFNHSLGGIGDVDFVIKDPRACGIDICVTEPEDADLGQYTFVEDYVPLDVVRSQYPGRGALVKADARISGFDTQKRDISAKGLIRGSFARLYRRSEPEKISAIPKGIIEEFFIQDSRKNIEDIGVVPLVDGLTKWADDKGIPFPGGRRILRSSNGTILEDCYNPFWDGLPNLIMMGWKIDLESAWGGDDIRGVKRMQQSYNRTLDAYTKNVLQNAVIRIIMDKGALEPSERNKLNNEVGQIIEKAMGREFNYQVPPLMDFQVVQYAVMIGQWIREKMGVAEPALTKDVPSIVTGPAVEGLQLMIQTPIRTAARRVEDFYQRVGQRLVSRVFQFYTSDRILHLIGDDLKWKKFEFKRLEILKDPKGKLRSQEDQRKAYQDFYFTVEPGSSLAIAKTEKAQRKMVLVQMGMLHPREVMLDLYQNPDEKLAAASEAKSKGLFAGVENAKSAA